MTNSYRGHPGVFVDALQMFQATQSRPYCYAGIAYILTMASGEYDENHEGLQEAMNWLEVIVQPPVAFDKLRLSIVA